jgi:hypothetical protein
VVSVVHLALNLGSRVKNTHAFKLPTFYIPQDGVPTPDVPIPNALEEICEDIDKAGWVVETSTRPTLCFDEPSI